ncbi:MAG: lipocalin family protein, partial [Paraprevotella sp.]|nr:lipocalin family protein [Paraprevotella sp.]
RMKKYLTFSWPSVAIAAGILSGCWGGQKSKDYMEDQDSTTTVVHTPDTAFYGHLGEGTGMSGLELITEDSDTLLLDKTNERTGEDGRILGEIANYTDQFAITTNDDNQCVNVALNISQLAQGWQSASDGQQSFRLSLDGKVKPLSSQQYKYNQWSLCNCELILQKETEGIHGAETRNDTLDILTLSPDSLVLQDIHTRTPEKFYRVK